MQPSGHDDNELPIEIETAPQVSASVIWLHGLGADGNDFVPIVRELRLPADLGIRFVFPHAPFRAVTINGGYVMRAWYDLFLDGSGLQQNSEHVRESVRTVARLIECEKGRGIEPSRVVLAGFSQGGAVALHAGLHLPPPVAGILALSAPIPDPEALTSAMGAANASTPVFLAHGSADPIVPFRLGQALWNHAQKRGLRVEWHEYPMAHTVCEAEITDMAAWLERILGA